MSQGIYEVSWLSTWKIELRLDDALYANACGGSVQARGKIVHRFRNKCLKTYAQKIDLPIRWDDSDFSVARIADASPI